MSWLILGFMLFLNHATLGQQDGDEMSLMDIINATEQLSEVGKNHQPCNMQKFPSNFAIILFFKNQFSTCIVFMIVPLKIRYFTHLLKGGYLIIFA